MQPAIPAVDSSQQLSDSASQAVLEQAVTAASLQTVFPQEQPSIDVAAPPVVNPFLDESFASTLPDVVDDRINHMDPWLANPPAMFQAEPSTGSLNPFVSSHPEAIARNGEVEARLGMEMEAAPATLPMTIEEEAAAGVGSSPERVDRSRRQSAIRPLARKLSDHYPPMEPQSVLAELENKLSDQLPVPSDMTISPESYLSSQALRRVADDKEEGGELEELKEHTDYAKYRAWASLAASAFLFGYPSLWGLWSSFANDDTPLAEWLQHQMPEDWRAYDPTELLLWNILVGLGLIAGVTVARCVPEFCPTPPVMADGSTPPPSEYQHWLQLPVAGSKNFLPVWHRQLLVYLGATLFFQSGITVMEVNFPNSNAWRNLAGLVFRFSALHAFGGLFFAKAVDAGLFSRLNCCADYNPVKNSNNSSPTDAGTRVPADASTRVPTDAGTRVPADASTRVPTDASTRVPTDASTREERVKMGLTPDSPKAVGGGWDNLPTKDGTGDSLWVTKLQLLAGQFWKVLRRNIYPAGIIAPVALSALREIDSTILDSMQEGFEDFAVKLGASETLGTVAYFSVPSMLIFVAPIIFALIEALARRCMQKNYNPGSAALDMFVWGLNAVFPTVPVKVAYITAAIADVVHTAAPIVHKYDAGSTADSVLSGIAKSTFMSFVVWLWIAILFVKVKESLFSTVLCKPNETGYQPIDTPVLARTPTRTPTRTPARTPTRNPYVFCAESEAEDEENGKDEEDGKDEEEVPLLRRGKGR